MVQKSYNYVIEAAMVELRERAYKEQRQADAEFEQLTKEAVFASQKAEPILNKLADDDRKVLEYASLIEHMMTEKQLEFYYIQGAKDFIALMKFLGAY